MEIFLNTKKMLGTFEGTQKFGFKWLFPNYSVTVNDHFDTLCIKEQNFKLSLLWAETKPVFNIILRELSNTFVEHHNSSGHGV